MKSVSEDRPIARPAQPIVVSGASAWVLPKPLRFVVRHFQGYLNTATPLRRGGGSALALGFFFAGLAYGAHVGGSAPHIMSVAAAGVGVKASDIVITGQVETREENIYYALGLADHPSLIGFDVGAARKRVLDLPWVSKVEIRKHYPGKLKVQLEEKAAFAVWQKNDHLTVVEKSGETIARFGISDMLNNRFAHLPQVVGDGAAKSAAQMLPVAGRHPDLAKRISAYVRVGDRRWDVVFDNGVRLKLPAYGLKSAFDEFAALDAAQNFLGRQLSVVDMRVADRIVVRLEENAAKERQELVSARLKAMKKAEKSI